MAAFGLGDGNVVLVPPEDPTQEMRVQAHDGGLLSFVAGPWGGFCTGGDDGLVRQVNPDGLVETLHEFPGQWVDHLAAHRGAGCLAAAAGRTVHLWRAEDETPLTLGPHPSSIGGLAFSPDGGMLAVAVHGGVSIWLVDETYRGPKNIGWKGSFHAPAFSPSGARLAVASQEKTVCVSNLLAGSYVAFEGYPTKVESLSWTNDESLLLTSGEQAFVGWPAPGAEADRQAEVFGAFEEGVMTAVAAHPKLPLAAGGFTGGAIFLAMLRRKAAIPLTVLGGRRVTHLGWSPDGLLLTGGSEDGGALLLDITLALGSAS